MRGSGRGVGVGRGFEKRDYGVIGGCVRPGDAGDYVDEYFFVCSFYVFMLILAEMEWYMRLLGDLEAATNAGIKYSSVIYEL